MLQKSAISPGVPLKPSMDFLLLREEAMQVIRQLAGSTGDGKSWTDHNLHDPGITILEQLCYALTDLGYRLQFSVPELLADSPAGRDEVLPGMPGIAEVLPSAPTTAEDWRKVMLDVEGTRSVHLNPLPDPSPNLYFDTVNTELKSIPSQPDNLRRIAIRGLHEIAVDAEEGKFQEARQALWELYHSQRPVGEDMENFVQLLPAPLWLKADLDLEPGVDPEQVVALVLLQADQYLAPLARFHTLSQMLGTGMGIDAIFEGPLLKNGFLDSAELANGTAKSVFYLSRIIEQAYGVKGVKDVRSMELYATGTAINVDDGVHYWVPTVTKGMVPRLEPEIQYITVRFNGVVKRIDGQRVRDIFTELRNQVTARSTQSPPGSDISVRNRKVAAYQSIQHQFPDNYGINAHGLPVDANLLRQAQAHQLKTWLLFFEQILSDYFAKAGNLGHFFALRDGVTTDYPGGDLSDVPLLQHSFRQGGHTSKISDQTKLQGLHRLERLLSHLIARYGHEVRFFPPTNQPQLTPLAEAEGHVGNMLALYRDMPLLTRARGQGPNVFAPPQPDAPGGLKTRIARLLGLRPTDPDIGRIHDLQNLAEQVDFLMVEHIHLRPLPQDYAQAKMLFRFRTGKISRIVRLRSNIDPDRYKFRCLSSGLRTLETGDVIEITFQGHAGKLRRAVEDVRKVAGLFTVAVPKELATSEKGNPQAGSWNKISGGDANLYADAWSLQVTYLFPSYDPRYQEAYQREYVEQLLRQETPAHVAIHIDWLDSVEMQHACARYARWRVAHQSYLQDKSIGSVHNSDLLMELRHARNQLIGSIMAGEVEPLTDLPVMVQAWAQATVTQDDHHNFTVTGTLSGAGTLTVKLPTLEPGIEYRLAEDVAPNDDGLYPVIAEGQMQPDGSLKFSLTKSGMSKGSNSFAVWALDPVQQVGALLHQKITLTLT
ncbi:MAG: hypothetical protein U0176_13775 [Bacteroidia bacterium]